ncbi:MAG: glycosyltransferase [Candidatus Omnitrophota bacterium]|nr:glycosyltransferase [Candidatus Omnitrophota bacterium]
MDKASVANPLVSVIMNCRNGEEYLREALGSIYAQSYTDWEIIFWDNASTDGSAGIAKSYGPKLRYFKSDQCFVLGKARNLAMAEARGQYLAFLDCDDKWLPRTLEKQVGALNNRSDIDFVYGNYFRLIMPKTGNLIPALSGQQPEGNVFGSFLYNYPVALQTAMLRMSAVKRLDEKFDEKLGLSEEFDFFMRILLKLQALYIDEPLAIYRIHGDMSSKKLHHMHPMEMRYILNKLKKIDDSIELKYASEIRYYEAKLAYWQAKVHVEKHDPKSARSELAPYRFAASVFFVLYILTYLPYTAWKWLHDRKIEGKFRWIK